MQRRGLPSHARRAVRSTALAVSMVALQALPLAAAAQAGAASATADAAAQLAHGQRLFMRCTACHDLAAGSAPKVGPSLHGLFGRRVASVPGFNYSDSLKSQRFEWDDEMLARWVESPVAVAPGTIMGFIGLPNPADRQALIAYLRQATR
jgi:cytochrome c